MVRRWALGLVLVLAAVGSSRAPLFAQDEESDSLASLITVEGEVVDALTGHPLAGIFVTIHDEWKVTNTDELGYFSLTGISRGMHELGVYGLGFITIEEYMDFVPGEILGINLSPAPVAIEGIEVAVLSNSLKEYRSFGTRYDFIGAETMVEYRRKYGRITDMIRARFPGVRVYADDGPSGGMCVVSNRASSSPNESNNGCALMMVDGMEMDGNTVAILHPEEIATIRYITRLEARLFYGERGKYGILLVETVIGPRRR